MARPKSKIARRDIKLTLPVVLIDAAREDIENLSSFVSTCLRRHLISLCKQDPTFKEKLIKKYGEDIIYIMRSSKVKAEGTFEDESNLPHMSDEELYALLDEIDNY